MSTYVADAFNSLSAASRKYRKIVDETVAQYAGDIDNITKTYSADVARSKREVLRAAASSTIARAAKELEKAANECADTLSDFLSDQMRPRIDSAEMRLARFYIESGIKPTTAELRILLAEMGACYLGKRAIAAYAERHGFEVGVPTIDEYLKEVDDIRTAHRAPFFYAPDKYTRVALELLPDVPMLRNPDGSVKTTQGRPDVLNVIMANGLFNSREKSCAAGAERWEKLFIPPEVKYDPKDFKDKESFEAAKKAEADRVKTVAANAAYDFEIAKKELRERGRTPEEQKALDNYTL